MFCEICKSDKTIKDGLLIDLGKHLSKTHNFSKKEIKEYYDMYLKKENDGLCYCGRNTTFLRINLGYSKYCSTGCSSEINIKRINTKNWSNSYCRERMLKGFNDSRHDSVIIEKRMKSLKSNEFRQKCSNRMKQQWAENAEYSKKMKSVLLNNYINQGIHIGPNKKEYQLLNILNKFGFEFTGANIHKSIAGKFPDFIDEENKRIIELYGDYWHRNETSQQTNERIDLFKSKGYDTLIIWERELKNISSLRFKIKDFVNGEELKCVTK